MKKKFGARGFRVVGIHSPEFDFEKKRSRVEAAVKKYELNHPIMMDNDFGYWKALGNRYWPSFYLVDRQGVIAAQVFGEVHEGDRRAEKIDELIERLLRKS